jgi:hypothetical protein
MPAGSPTPDIDLAALVESRSIAEIFQGLLTEANGVSPPTIESCTRRDTKCRPHEGLVAAYELACRSGGGESFTTFGVLELLEEEITYRLLNEDAELHLRQALSPVLMGSRLAELADADCEPGRLPIAKIIPVRYKPRRSCVLKYELRGPRTSRSFYVKVLASPQASLGDLYRRLHDDSHGGTGILRVLQPEAYLPDLGILVFPALEDSAELHERLFSREEGADPQYLSESLGSALAGFHTVVTAPGHTRPFESELSSLRRQAELFEYFAPHLFDSFQQTVEELSGFGSSHGEPAVVASHGAFRTDQVLVAGDELIGLDLEGFCWANRARDIGNLLAYLDWRSIRRPEQVPLITDVIQAFAGGYEKVAPIDRQWTAAFRAASRLKIAARRLQSLTFAEWPLLPRLLKTSLTPEWPHPTSV